MSIFPTRILLATDGSKEAELAARTAVDIAATTNSVLHMVTIARVEYHSGYDIPESGALLKGIYESNKRKAQCWEPPSIVRRRVESEGGISVGISVLACPLAQLD
jgi:nucleotide-binding universal stress UspA family protein